MAIMRLTQRNVRSTLCVAIFMMIVNRGKSIVCPDICRGCNDFNGKPWCLRCVKGYFWASGGQCLPCDPNCNMCTSCSQQCENVGGQCVSGCKTGYYEHYDTEQQSHSCKCRFNNCKDCREDSCKACADGYFLHNGLCVSCNVGYCKTCYSQNNCHECKDGYFLKSSQHCMKYDGKWGAWSEYGSCTSTCGNGTKTRTRSCDVLPTSDGNTCVGANMQTVDCYEERCPDIMSTSNQMKDNMFIIGAVVGGAVLLIIGIIAGVIFIRRRNERGNRNNEEKETAGINLLNREGVANLETGGNHGSTAEEDNTYALPNKFRTQNEKDEKQKELLKSNVRASVSLEAPVIPVKSSLYYEDSDLEELDPNVPDNNEDTGDVPEDNDTYYNTFVRRKVTKEALLAKLADHNIEDFKDEYERLADGLTRDYKEALKPENKSRNRYKLVYPYDVSRVIISDSRFDYINANYIDGFNQPRAYIACLGPTASTTDNFNQFWRMIWQEKVEKIVMLTNLMEGETMKCEQYWPCENNAEKYGQISVRNIHENIGPEYTVRTFQVKKNNEMRDVIHVHFTAWPDKNVPDDVISLLEFRQKVNDAPTKLDGPIVVHCSAGIGRTGTYIALDILIKEGNQEQSVDVFGCVNGIRGQRTKLVQNLPQYMYLHFALVHQLTFGEELISPDNLHKNLSDGKKEVLKQQFRTLQLCNPRYLSVEEAAAVRRNRKKRHKNRPDADIPGFRNRVKLRHWRKTGNEDYINAVYINGPLPGSRYIVAQTPLPATVVDFLDMVMQENVDTIVSMDPPNIRNETVGSILPTDAEAITIGPYMVRCHKQNKTDGYVLKELEITKSETVTQKKMVHHYQCLLWDMEAHTPSSSSLFVGMVRDIETKAASTTSATLVYCLNAATRSCLYCAISILAHQIDSSQNVNIINTVTRIRARRPRAIPNEDQFIFCHECVAEFHESAIN